jgi:transposase
MLYQKLIALYLKFHAHEVSTVTVHRINRDEAIAISSHNVTILFELKCGHVGS